MQVSETYPKNLPTCLFVCLGWRPGPRPRDRFRQRYPLRDLAYAKLPGKLYPGSYGTGVWGGKEGEGGEAPTKPPYDMRTYQLRGVPRKGNGREGRGFSSSPLPVLT